MGHSVDAEPEGRPSSVSAPSAKQTLLGTRTPGEGSQHFDTSSSGPPPERVGRFVIDRELGAGGMGVVYAGHDPDLGRKVAIKLLHDKSAAQPRLLREGQALARLTHENVVQVFEIGTSDDQVFIAMQFVEGQTLGDWIAEKGRDWQSTVDMFAAAGAGLVAAHREGITHRDFKPDNVLVGVDGVPRVLDFGIARTPDGPELLDPPDASPAASPDASPAGPSTSLSVSASAWSLSADLTRTGAIMGTPAYMSPEQAIGEPVGPASDQFSFCVALYEALYGQRPVEGDSIAAIILNLQTGDIRPPPPDSDVPAWLHAALLRGLSTDPDQRFESVDALITELTSYRATNLQDGGQARVVFLLVSLLILVGAVGGNVVAVRFFDVPSTPRSTLPGTIVSTVVLTTALLAMRKRLTRSGLDQRIFWCFVAYVFYGPSTRLAAWRVEITMDQMMPLEMFGGSLAAIMFAAGFDPRTRWGAFVFFLAALATLVAPERTLELHALGNFAFFGGVCWLWYRDGLPARGDQAEASLG